MQQHLVPEHSTLLNVSSNLQAILDSICELVTVYELMSKVNYTNENLIDNNMDITSLLAQNIQDSCNWVSSIVLIRVIRAFDLCEILQRVTVFMLSWQLNYLVTNDTNVMGSREFSEMPSSCAPEDVTRLHSYCYRVKIKENGQLERLVRTLVDSLDTYYSGTLTKEE